MRGSTAEYTSVALALTIRAQQQKTLYIYRKFILRIICGNIGPNGLVKLSVGFVFGSASTQTAGRTPSLGLLP